MCHNIRVLNLIITGIPSIQTTFSKRSGKPVLKLIITGMPSIFRLEMSCKKHDKEMF